MRTLELRHGEFLVGTLRETDYDFPWINCTFEPTPAFEEFRSIFVRRLRSVESEEFDVADEMYDVIENRLQLIDLEDADRIGKFLLHIEGDAAWFRYATKEESWDDNV